VRETTVPRRARRWIAVSVTLLLVAYLGLRARALTEGGGTTGMPSRSAIAAERSGMLMKRVTLVVEPGGPGGLAGAWIERGAYTAYRYGLFPTRRPLRSYDGVERYLLAIPHPDTVPLTVEALRNEARTLLLGRGHEVTAWPVEPPFPDTAMVRAARPANDLRWRVVWPAP
jgi:hypothetical protein